MHVVVEVARAHVRWMGWNLVLAAVPLLVGFIVFNRRRRRRVAWWLGVATFVAFLPNAPYVVSDLVHLPDDLRAASSTSMVVLGILPVYAVFVAAGIQAYAVSLALVRRYLRSIGWTRRIPIVEIAIHAASAAGVVLGRVDRLNSWDPFTRPAKVRAALASLPAHPALVIAVALLLLVITQAVSVVDLAVVRRGRRVVGHILRA